MNVLLIMIPLSILFVVAAGIFFFWAVNHDQFEDLDSPGLLPVSDRLEREQQAGPDASEVQDETDDPDA